MSRCPIHGRLPDDDHVCGDCVHESWCECDECLDARASDQDKHVSYIQAIEGGF